MSAFGDVVQGLIGSETQLANELDGSSPAPAPSVGSRPAKIAGARAWTAPDASGQGQVSVHRDVLHGVAVGMRSDLQDLDKAVSRLDRARQGEGISITGNAGLVAGWPTATAFNRNASAAFTGVVRASQQSSAAHEDASTRLTSSAEAYDQAESDNMRAARSVGTDLSSVTGLVASYGSSGGPGASALGAQPSYPVKTPPVSAGFSGAGMSASTIMEILRGLDPGGVAAAGAAHTNMGTVLDMVAGRLAANANTLAQSWSGSAAQAAMGQFQQLHDRMATLAQQSLQVGSVLSWLGSQVLPQFTSLPDPRVSPTSLVLGNAVAGTVLGGLGSGLVGAGVGLVDALDGSAQAAADRTAQQYIAKLSGYLVTADQSLPNTIGAATASAGGSASGPAPAVPVTSVPTGGGSGAGARLPAGSIATLAGAAGGTGSGSTPKTTTGAAGAAGATLGNIGATGAAAKGAGAVGQLGAGTVGQLGAATPPASLQGATIPGGPLSSPAGSTPPMASASPLPSQGGLSGGLPGPVPSIPGLPGAPGGTGTGLGTGTATLDDATVPLVGQVSEGQPNEKLPGNVLPGASGLATELPGEQFGLPGVSGVPGTGAPVAGDVIGAQMAQAETDGALAGTDEATAASGMEGFPMMGAGGAARPDEQERIRQSWLNEDDLWHLPANLVPPVIDE